MRNYLVLALFCGLGLAACQPDNKPATNQATEQLSGKDLFKRYCVVCHGADGKLGLNGAKDLSACNLSLEERIELISNGKGAMTPFRSVLDAEEIKRVAEYSASLKQ